MGFLVFVFGVWFLFVFLFDSVESSNIEKHFSCSLIDPLLPNCLLFHFFFVKMTQGFLICCFQKQTVLLHYPSICTSTKMTAHTTNYTDHQAGSGEQELGRPGVADHGGLPRELSAFLKLLLQHPCLTLYKGSINILGKS